MFSLRDASTDAVTPRDASAMADDMNWRDHVARAAAEDVGRAGDEEAISQARRVVENWLSCCKWALVILVLSGALLGWLETSVLLRSADGQIHAEWTLMVIVATPLPVLAVRCVLRLGGGSLLLDRFVPMLQGLRCLLVSVSLPQDATTQDLTAKTTKKLYGALADKESGRPLSAPLSAAGSSVFWTAYAFAALGTILIVASVTGLGFGFGWRWESSLFGLDLRREVVEFVRGMIEFPALVLGCIGSDGLTPVAPAPIAPDDSETLAVRRSWVCALTAGVGVYVLFPMALWTVWNLSSAKRKMDGWQPSVASVSQSAAPATIPRNEPTPAPMRPRTAGGEPCTHLVRLEWPEEAVTLPAPLDGIVDLGNVDAAADLERVREILSAAPARVAIIGWLPVSPDRGIRGKLKTLAGASTHAPLLVLDGGHALRRADPPRTVAVRLDDWRKAASETGVEPFECDLAELTEASRRDLARAVGRGADHDVGREPPTASGSRPARR